MFCIKCQSNLVSPSRRKLGYAICISCGEEQARKEIERKKNRVAVGYNKGPLLYMGDDAVARQNLLGSMNAQGRHQVSNTGMPVVSGIRPEDPSVRVPKKIRRSIGILWIGGDPLAFYSMDDPRLKIATRKVVFNSNK